jgi:2-oxoglutarate ferredoxin oxidoreductase subunit alpha
MPATQSRINDFVLKIATVNGTGSASANGLLMKALFRMGIPVTGKNLFPSNIQGLPTWYEIRANHAGYMSASGRVDVMVAMNAQTYQKDLDEVSPGGFLIYDSTWPRERTMHRDDILCNEAFSVARIRILMKNVAYVGALAALMDIELGIIKTLLEETFASKPKVIESNLKAMMLGYDYSKENFTCPLPARAETMGDNSGNIMITGNEATGLGCLYAGATVGAWYPITPSTGVMDSFTKYCDTSRNTS